MSHDLLLSWRQLAVPSQCYTYLTPSKDGRPIIEIMKIYSGLLYLWLHESGDANCDKKLQVDARHVTGMISKNAAWQTINVGKLPKKAMKIEIV